MTRHRHLPGPDGPYLPANMDGGYGDADMAYRISRMAYRISGQTDEMVVGSDGGR